MTVFFTSDTHFGHNNIRKYCSTTRGHYAHVDEMDEDMIAQWNETVGQSDIVYHLGDFAFAPQARQQTVLTRLNGSIRIILGNHDRYLAKGLADRMLEYGLLDACYYGYHEARFDGIHIIMNHYAQRVWNGSHHGSIHVYGHSHGTLPGLGKSVDVGVDSAELGLVYGNMRPYSLKEVTDYLESKMVYRPDYHGEDTND